jgi:hypothetical protein
MTARDLLSNLRASNVTKPADVCLCMANLAHELRLSDGQRLNDLTDFTVFLRELAEAVEFYDVRV